MTFIMAWRVMCSHQWDRIIRCSAAGPKNSTMPTLLTRASIQHRGIQCSSTCLQANPNAASEDISKADAARGGTGRGAREEAGRTAGIVLFCSLVGVTAGLGVWQTLRYSWKVELIENRKQKIALEPIDLPTGSQGMAVARAMEELNKAGKSAGEGGRADSTSAGDDEGMKLLEDLEGRRIRVTGEFDHSKEVLVGPRGAPPGMKSSSGGSSMVPSPMGDYVYTPLRQKDGPVVLFNRGWAPRSAGPDWSRPEGKVTVVGVLKAAERRGTFSPVNNPETGKLLWLEKESLVKAAGLERERGDAETLPLLVLMEAVGPDDEDPREQTPMVKRQKHLGEFYISPMTHLMYAATWYTLAAAASVLTWVRFRRKPGISLKLKPPSA